VDGYAEGRATRQGKKLQDDRYEFHLWQTEIEDKTLIKKAAKIGVYLDEIVFPDTEDHNNVGRYHRIGDFGSELLRNEFRGPLVKAIREREPAYRKEQREQVEIYITLIAAALLRIELLEEDRNRWQTDCARAEAELRRECPNFCV
jgi:hypothetical protein